MFEEIRGELELPAFWQGDPLRLCGEQAAAHAARCLRRLRGAYELVCEQALISHGVVVDSEWFLEYAKDDEFYDDDGGGCWERATG